MFYRSAFLFSLVCALAACQGRPNVVPAKEEIALQMAGSIQQYHALLEVPSSQPDFEPPLKNREDTIQMLGFPGYVLGVEKAMREAVGFPQGPNRRVLHSHDPYRFAPPDMRNATGSLLDIQNQANQFRRVNNDPKVSYVSHLVGYDQVKANGAVQPSLLYTHFSETIFDTEGSQSQKPCQNIRNESLYENSWDALDCLQTDLDEKLQAAAAAGSPHTHVVLMAMGWANDQYVSIRRFNGLLHKTKLFAEREGSTFRPLVIGITWPSVWGGLHSFELLNDIRHVSSYPARSSDADEIGYTVANHVLNVIMPQIEAKYDISTVAIGHSMGARMLSRAYYSGHVLNNQEMRRAGEGPLLIGLQPAFSANRYSANIPPSLVGQIFAPAEGSPYQEVARPGGLAAFTWSEEDTANPVAQYVTGAKHVGGEPGHAAAEEIDLAYDRFVFHKETQDGSARQAKCAEAFERRQVLLIDATQSIPGHGEIDGPEVGAMIWGLISCVD